MDSRFTAERLAEDVDSSLKDLIGYGATNMAVLNLPDVSRAPAFSNRQSRQAALAEKVDQCNLRLPFLLPPNLFTCAQTRSAA